MGRWAQRRRAGGGSSPDSAPPTIAQLLEAHIDGIVTEQAVYTTPITAGDFSPGDFVSNPSGGTSTIVLQINATTIEIEFDNIVTGDDTLEYAGTNPNVITPDSVAIT